MRAQLEDVFASWSVSPAVMDELWAGAWWHLGTTFFRQAHLPWRGRLVPLLHLRMQLAQFTPSASQRRILRRNADLTVSMQAATVDDERRALFDRHKERFREGVPQALDDFIGPAPARVPVPALEFDVYAGDRLVAVSYLAVGCQSVASLYGFFDPDYSERSLGLYTLLLEIRYAQASGYTLYYPGYALVPPSSMDYKKRFHGLESYDWREGWQPFARLVDSEGPPPKRARRNVLVEPLEDSPIADG